MKTTVAPAAAITRMPQVARLGFDNGWLSLSPHFLNLGLPVLLVDYRLVEDVEMLKLESFGSRDPRQPLHTAGVQAEVSGGGVSLWSTYGQQPTLMAAYWREPIPTALLHSQRLEHLILMIGDTYAVQLSWSALWTDCYIGIARVARSHRLADPMARLLASR